MHSCILRNVAWNSDSVVINNMLYVLCKFTEVKPGLSFSETPFLHGNIYRKISFFPGMHTF
jgi:hypothetical protein